MSVIVLMDYIMKLQLGMFVVDMCFGMLFKNDTRALMFVMAIRN